MPLENLGILFNPSNGMRTPTVRAFAGLSAKLGNGPSRERTKSAY
jgi:hypothetical protein